MRWGDAQVVHFAVSVIVTPQELLTTLSNLFFDCVIVQCAPGGFTNEIIKALRAVVMATDEDATADGALMSKYKLREIFDQTFLCVRRDRVRTVTVTYTPLPQSRILDKLEGSEDSLDQYLAGVGNASRLLEDTGRGDHYGEHQLCFLELVFIERPSAAEYNAGEDHLKMMVTYLPGELKSYQEDAFVDVIYRKNPSLACGFWGPRDVNTRAIERIAKKALAASVGALTFGFAAGDSLTVVTDGSQFDGPVVHYPSYFIVFGATLKVRRPDQCAPNASWAEIEARVVDGGVPDLTAALCTNVPWWPAQEVSPFAPSLGCATVKNPCIAKWPPGIIENLLWIGRQFPSAKSRARFRRKWN